MVLIDNKPVDLHYPAPRKRILRIKGPYANDLWGNNPKSTYRSNDQVKIVVSLTREEVTEWATCKERILIACKDIGFEVFGIELEVAGGALKTSLMTPTEPIRQPKEVFQAFCKAEKVPAAIRLAGAEMMED